MSDVLPRWENIKMDESQKNPVHSSSGAVAGAEAAAGGGGEEHLEEVVLSMGEAMESMQDALLNMQTRIARTQLAVQGMAEGLEHQGRIVQSIRRRVSAMDQAAALADAPATVEQSATSSDAAPRVGVGAGGYSSLIFAESDDPPSSSAAPPRARPRTSSDDRQTRRRRPRRRRQPQPPNAPRPAGQQGQAAQPHNPPCATVCPQPPPRTRAFRRPATLPFHKSASSAGLMQPRTATAAAGPGAAVAVARAPPANAPFAVADAASFGLRPEGGPRKGRATAGSKAPHGKKAAGAASTASSSSRRVRPSCSTPRFHSPLLGGSSVDGEGLLGPASASASAYHFPFPLAATPSPLFPPPSPLQQLKEQEQYAVEPYTSRDGQLFCRTGFSESYLPPPPSAPPRWVLLDPYVVGTASVPPPPPPPPPPRHCPPCPHANTPPPPPPPAPLRPCPCHHANTPPPPTHCKPCPPCPHVPTRRTCRPGPTCYGDRRGTSPGKEEGKENNDKDNDNDNDNDKEKRRDRNREGEEDREEGRVEGEESTPPPQQEQQERGATEEQQEQDGERQKEQPGRPSARRRFPGSQLHRRAAELSAACADKATWSNPGCGSVTRSVGCRRDPFLYSSLRAATPPLLPPPVRLATQHDDCAPCGRLAQLRAGATEGKACCRAHLRELRPGLGRRLLAGAQSGSSADVRRLVEAGADVNARSSSKWTALHRAAAKCNNEVVEELLRNGAKVDAATAVGFTALHIAAANDLCGRCVAQLIRAGANVEARTRLGKTPLHYAADGSNASAVNALLQAGASKVARDMGGKTPLDFAKTPCLRRLLAP